MKLNAVQLPSPSTGGWRTWADNLLQALISFFSQLQTIINGGISLDNLEVFQGTVLAPVVPHQEFSVSVGMRHPPTTLWWLATNAPAQIYKGNSTWTKDTIYLKSTVGGASFEITVI